MSSTDAPIVPAPHTLPPHMSISTAAWDGYDLSTALSSMSRLGIKAVELAFIKGYVADFTDADLNAELARALCKEMRRHDQRCRVLSAHIELGDPDALKSLGVRVRFAAELGASYLITNAASRSLAGRFYDHLDDMTAIARDHGIHVCFENPGNASDNLINQAADLPGFLARVDRDVCGVNFDPGNVISHRPALSPTREGLEALPHCGHLHLKAVTRHDDGYAFGAMGTGDIEYAEILAGILARDLPFSLELPFRLQRDTEAQPHKRETPLALDQIEQQVADSLAWVANICQSTPTPS